jgi:hypothetical protein
MPPLRPILVTVTRSDRCTASTRARVVAAAVAMIAAGLIVLSS